METLTDIHEAKWDGVIAVNVDAGKKVSEAYCISAGIDFMKRDAIIDRQHKRRMESYIRCPGCDKEMLKKSLPAHQAKACPVSKAVRVTRD